MAEGDQLGRGWRGRGRGFIFRGTEGSHGVPAQPQTSGCPGSKVTSAGLLAQQGMCKQCQGMRAGHRGSGRPGSHPGGRWASREELEGGRGPLQALPRPQGVRARPAPWTPRPCQATSHPTSCDGTSHLDPEIKPTPQIPSGPLCSWGLMEHSGLFVSQKITFVPGMGKKKIIPSAGAQLCRALATGCVVTVSFRGSPTSKWA